MAARLDLKRDGIDKRDVVTRDSVRNERDKVLAVVERIRAYSFTVGVEIARLSEDSDAAYRSAFEAWDLSLKGRVLFDWARRKDQEDALNGGGSFDQILYREGIGAIHLAWACLLRGEYLRSWRHAGRARQLLNRRVVAETWWFAELERICGLAIARACGNADVFRDFQHLGIADSTWDFRQKNYLLSCEKGFAANREKHFLRSQASVQKKLLTAVLSVATDEHPWRAAEIQSTLGQLCFSAQDDQESIQESQEYLNCAYKTAVKYKHVTLEGYVLEALARVEDDPSKRQKLLHQSIQLRGCSQFQTVRMRRLATYCIELLNHLSRTKSDRESLVRTIAASISRLKTMETERGLNLRPSVGEFLSARFRVLVSETEYTRIELKPQPAIEHGQNQFLYYVHASVRLDISGKGEIYGDLEGFDATKVFFFVDLEQEKGLDRDEIRRTCGPKKDFPECSMQVSFGDYNIGLRIRMACADEINPNESMVSKIHYDRGYSLRVTCTVDGENHLLDSLGRFNLRESGKSKEFDEWIESLAQQIIN